MNIIPESIQQLGIDTVRVLAADAVQRANSGPPGTPMRLAPVGHVLYKSDSLQRIGVAADHGGFALKEYILKMLIEAGCGVFDFGNTELNSENDYRIISCRWRRPLLKALFIGGIAFLW